MRVSKRLAKGGSRGSRIPPFSAVGSHWPRGRHGSTPPYPTTRGPFKRRSRIRTHAFRYASRISRDGTLPLFCHCYPTLLGQGGCGTRLIYLPLGSLSQTVVKDRPFAPGYPGPNWNSGLLILVRCTLDHRSPCAIDRVEPTVNGVYVPTDRIEH